MVIIDHLKEKHEWRVCDLIPERPSLRKLGTEIASIILVIAGVMGEFGVGLRLSSIGGQLQSKNAELRSKSEQLVELVRQDAAQAKASGAMFEKEAAEANLEAEKLKQTVAWRVIPPDVASRLEKILEANPGSVNLGYTDGDNESLFLAIQFAKILERAHWKTGSAGAIKYAGAIQFGIVLPDSNGTDATKLRVALSVASIGYTIKPLPAAVSSMGVAEISAAPRLIIGSKMPNPIQLLAIVKQKKRHR